MTSKDPQTADHLVVFLHGLDGHPQDLTHIATQLKQRRPDRIITHLVISYNTKTHNGLDNAGMSVAHEVEEFTSLLHEKGFTIRYISFVGHSFGGLVARYAIGLLHDRHFFDHIKPMNFTTFATPHLGTRKITGSLIGNAFNFLAPAITGSRSASQLFLLDDYAGRPLMVAMAEEDSAFFRALQTFPHKSVYANVTLDYLVPYYTAAMSAFDFSVNACSHIPGYEPVIYDLTTSTRAASDDGENSAQRSVKPERRLELQHHQRFMLDSLDKLRWSKYPVHTNSWSPHTAILVFKVWNEKTCKGKIVVKHFTDMFVEADDHD